MIDKPVSLTLFVACYWHVLRYLTIPINIYNYYHRWQVIKLSILQVRNLRIWSLYGILKQHFLMLW